LTEKEQKGACLRKAPQIKRKNCLLYLQVMLQIGEVEDDDYDGE
jgi:hypothetical protein